MKHLLLASTIVLAAGCASQADVAEAPAPAAPVVVAAAPAAPPAPPAAPAPAAAPAPLPSIAPDYAKASDWLCRPGLANNPCETNIDATIVKADGSMTVEKFTADPNAPIDCFYVYPTVSLDPFTQSDLIPGPEELNVVKSQLARLGSKCRIYAPMYRQFTLGALRAGRGTGDAVPARGNRADANADVDAAWKHYLEHDNKGRGVVILGHSQGAGQVNRLVSAMVDGKPDQARLVSLITMGTSVQAPKGADVGGTFKSIPACRRADQTGCVITFSSYRDNIPPSENALFGVSRGESESLCTNPAALAGGKAANPKAYWSTGAKEWVKGKKIDTPFVMTPGLVTTECVKRGNHSYLEVHVNADAADPRVDDPGTDVMAQGKPDPSWGLHLNDANIGMGDLVDVVGKQAAAWKKAHP
jgi:hypothetical protein